MIASIAIAKLRPSVRNVRRGTDTAADNQLMADIDAHGLLQNLVVIPLAKPKGTYAVIAGERRRRALEALVESGRKARTDEVACLVIDDPEAEEASLAENFQRLALNPADECLAFQQVIAEGGDAENVARRFGLTVRFVEGRLRLARLAPVIFEALGSGQITLDVAKAYAVTSDQERQTEVFEALGRNWDANHPDAIRRRMLHETVTGADRRARLVGADAYVEAGGRIERDLFTDEEGARWLDIALLNTLATERLDAIAAETRAEQGLAFVKPTFGWGIHGSDVIGLERLVLEPAPLTAEEDRQVEAIEAEIEALIGTLEQDDLEEAERTETEAKVAALEGRIEAITERMPDLDPETRAIAGGFLVLNDRGEARLANSFYVPVKDDEPDPDEVGEEAPDPSKSGETKGPCLSQRLVEELAMQRRDILAVHVAANPHFARDLATFLMVDRDMRHYRDDPGSSLSASPPTDPIHDFQTPDARAIIASRTADETLDRSWTLADDHGARFDAFRSLTDEAKAAWLAHAIAGTLKASLNIPGGRHCAFHDHLATLLDIDVATWWRPTGANYFDKVTKDMILGALREVGGDALAGRYAKAKKAELAQTAEHVFAGDVIVEADVKAAALAWVPEAMRFMPGPAHDDETSDPPFDVDEPGELQAAKGKGVIAEPPAAIPHCVEPAVGEPGTAEPDIPRPEGVEPIIGLACEIPDRRAPESAPEDDADHADANAAPEPAGKAGVSEQPADPDSEDAVAIDLAA